MRPSKFLRGFYIRQTAFGCHRSVMPRCTVRRITICQAQAATKPFQAPSFCFDAHYSQNMVYHLLAGVQWSNGSFRVFDCTEHPPLRDHFSLKINGCDPTVRKCAPEPFHSIQMKLKLAGHFLQKSTRWRLSWFNMHQIKRQTHV